MLKKIDLVCVKYVCYIMQGVVVIALIRFEKVSRLECRSAFEERESLEVFDLYFFASEMSI